MSVKTQGTRKLTLISFSVSWQPFGNGWQVCCWWPSSTCVLVTLTPTPLPGWHEASVSPGNILHLEDSQKHSFFHSARVITRKWNSQIPQLKTLTVFTAQTSDSRPESPGHVSGKNRQSPQARRDVRGLPVDLGSGGPRAADRCSQEETAGRCLGAGAAVRWGPQPSSPGNSYWQLDTSCFLPGLEEHTGRKDRGCWNEREGADKSGEGTVSGSLRKQEAEFFTLTKSSMGGSSAVSEELSQSLPLLTGRGPHCHPLTSTSEASRPNPVLRFKERWIRSRKTSLAMKARNQKETPRTSWKTFFFLK